MLGLLGCPAVVLVSQEILFYQSVVGESVVRPRIVAVGSGRRCLTFSSLLRERSGLRMGSGAAVTVS